MEHRFTTSSVLCNGSEDEGGAIKTRFWTARDIPIRLDKETGEVVPICNHFQLKLKQATCGGGQSQGPCGVYQPPIQP